jgi:hypothetical protein
MKTLLWFLFILHLTIGIFPQQKLGKQTVDEWRYIIDTTWGQGLSTAEKLDFFDTYWNKVNQTWGGFPNLQVNWDSLKNYYRPIVEAGVSRGRFQGILSRLILALHEVHAYIIDPGIDSIFGIYYDAEGVNFKSAHYDAGIPLINLSSTIQMNYFGAGVTVYMDSIALVYSVMPNHPFNLQPGDVILGYDGLPWKENLKNLLNQEIPLIAGSISAASTESVQYIKVRNIGLNWGLFNTIDILKYSSGDTLHYPTSMLSGITPPYPVSTDQLPIDGVPFPLPDQNKMVSWGIVDGTTIGYIYVWDWKKLEVAELFGQAVDELMHLHKVTGLILDFRRNGGGQVAFANKGFEYLFNFFPASNIFFAVRVPGDDHFLFSIFDTKPSFSLIPTIEMFDHPIAVLTGPLCLSAGDYNAFRMRFHPMARFFGKKSMGAYTYTDKQSAFSSYNYRYAIEDGSMYSNYNNEGLMIHKSFPVDEEVWLTPDGVAKGQDDVVISALEWINNLVYPHNIILDKNYYSIGHDTIHISAIIKNPNSHLLAARGYIHNLNDVLIDSLDLTKKTLTKGGENWTGQISAPAMEDIFKVSVNVYDETTSENFTVTHATRLTTIGPLKVESVVYNPLSNHRYSIKPFIKNEGSNIAVNNIQVELLSDNPWITTIFPAYRTCPSLLPGEIKSVIQAFAITYDSATFPGYFNLNFRISSDSWPYWVDSIQVLTGIEEEVTSPSSFSLEQNYPNPFNPTTTIGFGIPEKANVRLSILNILGEEIKVLFNEEKEAGYQSIDFNASDLPSGVYFYQLRAGSFIVTRKMLLLR